MLLLSHLGTRFSWMEAEGPLADVVLTSRIRLARNLQNRPFPHRAQIKDLRAVVGLTSACLRGSPELGSFHLVTMDELTEIEKQSLVESHLASQALLSRGKEGALIFNRHGSLSVMVNEEDHFRLQVLGSGFQFAKFREQASHLDDLLDVTLQFAFSERYGFLTACPTNVGTGLRASVMVHLPALDLSGRIKDVLETVAQGGMAVRGLYGEGSEARGNLYQISNQVTLGVTESQIESNMTRICHHLVEQETQARDQLMQTHELLLQDRVWRAVGLLSEARSMASNETVDLLSYLRLGVDLNLVKGITSRTINQLMVWTRPGFLQMLQGRELTSSERDVLRAELIREKMAVLRSKESEGKTEQPSVLLA